jgi:NADH-quinone oxidoreductase subunit G
MAYIKIDDKEFEVENGITILQAAKKVGIKIPHYCYHPKLSIVGSCRMCLVEVQGAPKLMTACSTRIGEMPPERKIDGKYDMVVFTQTEKVKTARESVLEFLLLNHPLDCPECDQAGYCKLQDYSFKYGKDHSRYEFPKRVPPKKDLGPTILLYTTRCILCTRCVRFTREISGTEELFVNRRGARAEIDTFPGAPLNNKLSMNVADICPVGALVTKDFLFKPRIWNYKNKKSICTLCSKGCNISVDYIDYENKIYRIKPVRNDHVNEHWMCDEGRLIYHDYEKLERLTRPLMKVNDELVATNWFNAYQEKISRLIEFPAKEVAFVISAYATNEEMYLLKKLRDERFPEAKIFLADNFKQTDDETFPGFTIEGQKAPNVKGFEAIFGKIEKLSANLNIFRDKSIKAVYYIGGDIFASYSEELMEAMKNLEFLVVQDVQNTPLTELADVVLPSAIPYEKDGTYTNSQGRVQRARRILVAQGGAKTDFEILVDLFEKYDLPAPVRPQKVFNEMSKVLKEFEGMDYKSLGSGGMLLASMKSGKEVSAK